MKKKLTAAVLAAALAVSLTACSSGGSAPNTSQGAGTEGTAAQETQAAEKEIERKEFNTVYSAEISNLNYLVSSMSSYFRFVENVVDALVDFDQYGRVIPCLAESWEVSDDELTYTFHLREGVNWYTCEGEEYAPVTAQDFVDAAKWLLTKTMLPQRPTFFTVW